MFDTTEFEAIDATFTEVGASDAAPEAAPAAPALTFPATLKDVAAALDLSYPTLRNKWIGKIEAIYADLNCEPIRDESKRVTEFGYEAIDCYIESVYRNNVSHEAYESAVRAKFEPINADEKSTESAADEELSDGLQPIGGRRAPSGALTLLSQFANQNQTESLDGEFIDPDGVLAQLGEQRSAAASALSTQRQQALALSATTANRMNRLLELIKTTQTQAIQAKSDKFAQWDAEVESEVFEEFIYKKSRRDQLMEQLEQVDQLGKSMPATRSPQSA
jgi:hypothetical protein